MVWINIVVCYLFFIFKENNYVDDNDDDDDDFKWKLKYFLTALILIIEVKKIEREKKREESLSPSYIK